MTPRVSCLLASLLLASSLGGRAVERASATPRTDDDDKPSAAATPKAKAGADVSEKKTKPEPRVKHEADGDVIITLDVATQKLMGLQTAALEAAHLAPEIKGYGRVLDVSTLIAAVADLAPAQAAREASQAELKRLQTLLGQNNASERAMQAAQATAARDQAQVDSTRLRLLAAWGTAIASRDDLLAFARSLAALDTVLVQVELPAGASLAAPPKDARLLTLAEAATPIAAKLIGPAMAVDPLSQGRGFLFQVSPNTNHLAPGQALTALVALPGEAAGGVALPRQAVVRFNGGAWVYVQTAETKFERKEVALERPLADTWFVRASLKSGDKVVVTGAQQLLSEELKGSDEGGD